MPTTNPQSSHAPLASLAAHWNACKGDIPPPLVGASVTLVDHVDPSKARIYLFGGRLVTTRRMVNDMYELNLLTLQWTRLSGDARNEEDTAIREASTPTTLAQQPLPHARYFHSCNLWDNKLVVFGGMGYVNGSDTDLGVLDEVVLFDLHTQTWDLDFFKASSAATSAELDVKPQARYAHLSSTTADALVIIGGQDMSNRYVEEINVLDLRERRWTHSQPYDKQRGSYRSLAVEPLSEVIDSSVDNEGDSSTTAASMAANATLGETDKDDTHPLLSPSTITMLPMSSRPVADQGRVKPLPVYVYTNYNFTDVRREMEVIQLQPDGLETGTDMQIEDKSTAMSGASLPPGLRFPTGAVLGEYLLISGTYLANTSQTFALWALHLPSMAWSRLDVGPLLSTGSWNRGILWHSQSRMIVFGHRDRELVADYNHRQTNWNHALMIELEAWGITQPPEKKVSSASIQLGLNKLASSTIGSFSASLTSGLGTVDEETGDPILAFGGRGDFEIICSDGMRLGCDRIVLERRWPWFAGKMREYDRKVKSLTKNGSPSKRTSRPGTGTGEQLSALMEVDERVGQKQKLGGAINLNVQVDPRITPRQLHMAEPSPVVLALLIFLYTRCICTQLQRHPAIVAALLIVTKVYEMKDLEVWTKHAAHVIMSTDLAPPTSPSSTFGHHSGNRNGHSSNLPILERHRLAVALYEAATMSGFEALQIRALRTVMSIAKFVQRSSTSTVKASGTSNDSTSDVASGSLQNAQMSPVTAGFLNDRHDSYSGTALSPAVASPSYPSPLAQRNDSMHGRLTEGLDGASSNKRRSSRASALNAAGDGVSGGDGQPSSITAAPNIATPSFPTLSRSSTHSNQSNGTSSAAQNQQRRPSAPLLSMSHSNEGPLASVTTRPPSNSLSTVSTASTRKRFSIFGRATADQAVKSANASATHIITEGQVDGDRSQRGSTEQQTVAATGSRSQRSDTSGTVGAGSIAAKSTSSLTGISSATYPLGSPNEGGSTSSLPRVGEFGNIPKSDAGPGRKMSATLSRLKGGRQASLTATSANEEAIAGATVITAPAKLSTSGSEISPASPAHSASGGGKDSPRTKGRRGPGQLDKKDIIALNGIFA